MKTPVTITNNQIVYDEALKLFCEVNNGVPCELVSKGTRTLSQNSALHVLFQLLADTLNEMGLDQRKVLKPSYSIPWTTEAIKTNLWKPLQKAMFSKESTTELSKQEEINEIHRVLFRELGEKHGVEFIPFPSLKENEVDSKGKIKIDNY